MSRDFVKIALLAGTAIASAPAFAQQASQTAESSKAASGLEDIVVTAQKRPENVQSIPLAITAVSGDSLAERNISSVSSLATSVPSMTIGSFGGQARISIRGVGYDNVGQGHEGRIAYHVNGIYISRPADVLGTFYDIDHVAVLRGPQGTLYGRNATGGAINVVTKAPTDQLEGYLRVGYGNYNALTSEGAVGGPLVEGVRFRVAFTVEDRDGYGQNIVTKNDIDDARRRGIRGALSFDLGSSGKLDLSADYYREKDRNYGTHYLGQANATIPRGIVLGGFVPADFRDIANNFDPANDRESYGFSAQAQFDLGGSATLKSISAYRHSDFSVKTDGDATSGAYSIVNYYTKLARQFSQEFQVSGSTGGLKYILGAYYFDEKIDGGAFIPFERALVPAFAAAPLFVQGFAGFGLIHTKAVAGFGQLDFDLSDKLTVTLGGRYSWEKHTVSDRSQFNLTTAYPPQIDLSAVTTHTGGNKTTDKSFTPKFQISYTPQEDLLFYASVSKGFKSGGFDIGSTAPAFKPETLWSYEGGMKGTFADGRVRINAAGFYYDYANLQVSKVVFNVIQILNAASSKVYGAEAEITVIPAPGFQIDAAPSWLHTEYKNFVTTNPSNLDPNQDPDQSGNQLIQAPKFSIRAGAEYNWQISGGHLKLRGELIHQDRIFFTPFNEKQLSRAPNTKFNAFLNYEREHWDASLYILNITNKTTIANALASSSLFGFPVLGTLEPPRTYGAKVGYRF